MLAHLKVSKTDPFTHGQTIDIGKTNSPLGPISGMVAYLNSRARLHKTPVTTTGIRTCTRNLSELH